MTQAQQEAMDAVSHMTAKEIKEFAVMLRDHLEKKIRSQTIVKCMQVQSIMNPKTKAKH